MDTLGHQTLAPGHCHDLRTFSDGDVTLHVQAEQQGPCMTDVTLVLGEWNTPDAGLQGHLQCSMDVFTESSSRRFAASLKVRLCRDWTGLPSSSL